MTFGRRLAALAMAGASTISVVGLAATTAAAEDGWETKWCIGKPGSAAEQRCLDEAFEECDQAGGVPTIVHDDAGIPGVHCEY